MVDNIQAACVPVESACHCLKSNHVDNDIAGLFLSDTFAFLEKFQGKAVGDFYTALLSVPVSFYWIANKKAERYKATLI